MRQVWASRACALADQRETGTAGRCGAGNSGGDPVRLPYATDSPLALRSMLNRGGANSGAGADDEPGSASVDGAHELHHPASSLPSLGGGLATDEPTVGLSIARVDAPNFGYFAVIVEPAGSRLP